MFKIPYALPLVNSSDANLLKALKVSLHSRGKLTKGFENALSDFIGAKAVVVNNGTSAILASLIACEVKQGDMVIVPTYTFASVVNSVLILGARPILVDSDPKTFNMDITKLQTCLKEHGDVKAIIHVDVAGVAGDLDALTEIVSAAGVSFIEDAAEGLGGSYNGRRIGSCRHLTTFSFHPAKQITTLEGGAITTTDQELYERLRLIVNHGMSETYEHVSMGLNFRLTGLQSALGLSQLRRLNFILKKRKDIASEYFRNLKDRFKFQCIPEYMVEFPWGMFLILTKDSQERDVLYKRLLLHGVEAKKPWKPVHLQPFHSQFLKGSYPMAEDIYSRILSLPIGSGMNKTQVQAVLSSIGRSTT